VTQRRGGGERRGRAWCEWLRKHLLLPEDAAALTKSAWNAVIVGVKPRKARYSSTKLST